MRRLCAAKAGDTNYYEKLKHEKHDEPTILFGLSDDILRMYAFGCRIRSGTHGGD